MANYAKIYINTKKTLQKIKKIKKQDRNPTRSGEGGIEAVKVLPLPFGAVVFDDLFCAELIGPVCCSKHKDKADVSGLDFAFLFFHKLVQSQQPTATRCHLQPA